MAFHGGRANYNRPFKVEEYKPTESFQGYMPEVDLVLNEPQENAEETVATEVQE